MDVAETPCPPWRPMDALTLATLSFELLPHPRPAPPEPAARFRFFPLGGGSGPWLCTQGVGGRLTHYFPESYHAFDLRCAVGTPIVAVADGVVAEVRHDCRCTGVHCDNLTDWNSIALAVEPGLIVEYVHLDTKSARVRVGDVVRGGDVLCLSGETGFAPEPHVHIEAHSADDPTGPSVLVELVDESGVGYVPVAGARYGPAGRV